tara:strand:- start:6512 stop:6727 length:216 start_codon:yes stop_codon:yes gene_type:complete
MKICDRCYAINKTIKPINDNIKIAYRNYSPDKYLKDYDLCKDCVYKAERYIDFFFNPNVENTDDTDDTDNK